MASLEGLPQGKKILELAAAVAEGRKQTHQHLEKFQELDEELTRLFSAFPKDVCSNSDMESAIRVQTMVHECTKVDGQVSSSAEWLSFRVPRFVLSLNVRGWSVC